MTVRWRLTLILLLTMLPAAVFSLHDAWSVRESEIERIELNTHRLALVAAAYHRELLDGTRRVLTVLSQLPEIRTGGAEACTARLSSLLATFPEYRDLAVIDGRGDILCNANPSVERDNVRNRRWFHEIRDSLKFTIGEYIVGGVPGMTILPVALPIITDGRFAGAVVASVSISWLERLMERISLPEFGAVHLLGSKGAVLAVYPPMSDATRLLPDPSQFEKTLTAGRSPPVFAATDRTGASRLYGVSPIEGGQATVLFSVPQTRVLKGVAEQFRSQLAGPLAMWVLAIIAAWLSSEFLIARWIRRLSRAAAALSRGDFSVRPRVPKSPTELRRLAQAFSVMADTIQAREGQLRGSLKEKEVLLKEIHHRVNNNLQTVISLLNLQSRGITDPSARRALATTQMRVRTLALVHKHLYEGENLAAVDMKALVIELCGQLWRLYRVDQRKVPAVIEMPPLHLTPDTAIPLGLLITEATANALMHAFPDDRTGRVEITLSQDESGATLRIADNGVGQDAGGPNAAKDEKLGITLIRALALQLRARLVFEGPPGTAVVLQFSRPLDAVAPVRRPRPDA